MHGAGRGAPVASGLNQLSCVNFLEAQTSQTHQIQESHQSHRKGAELTVSSMTGGGKHKLLRPLGSARPPTEDVSGSASLLISELSPRGRAALLTLCPIALRGPPLLPPSGDPGPPGGSIVQTWL